MKDFLIALKEESDSTPFKAAAPARTKANPGRRAIYDEKSARVAAFRRRVVDLIRDEHLDDQVGRLGEAGALPILAIRATLQVVKRIEALPEVDAVIVDSNDLTVMD
ncbi:MAG TPA: hypothetical protein VF796_23205 [Humisphaera sp.]